MSKFFFILLALGIVTWLACDTTKKKSDDEATDSISIEDKVWDNRLHDIWVLTHLHSQSFEAADKRPQLELFPGDNKIGGNGGCNQFFGQMKADAKTIEFTQIGTTKKYCADVMDTEQEFIKELERAERYLIRDGKLYIFWGDQSTLVFQKVD